MKLIIEKAIVTGIPGSHISQTGQAAIDFAREHDCGVVLKFNYAKMKVNKRTNLEDIERFYDMAAEDF